VIIQRRDELRLDPDLQQRLKRVCTAMMTDLPPASFSRCLFFRSDGPAETMIAGLPA
jgi:hypothetical protein